MRLFITRKINEKTFVFFLLFLTLLPCKTHALTLSQIITEVRVRIKDTNTVRQRYSDTQLTNIINEGQKDVNNNTWAVTNSTTIALAVGTTYYTLPSDYIAASRVTWNYQNLYETTRIQLDSLNANTAWELQSTPPPPQSYFIDPHSTSLGIYPFISTFTVANPLGSLIMKYYAQPADLVNTTDVPFNGITRLLPYHTLLIVYSAYRIYLIEGETEKATAYMQEYVSRLAIMVEDTGKKPNYISSFSGPGNSR